MAKFNTKTKTKRRSKNREGADTYSQSPKLALASHILTSFVSDQFYRSQSQQIRELQEGVDAVRDKKFVAKAAIFARHEFHMRSSTHVIAGEIARHVKGEEWTKEFFRRVVSRPDDVLEILSYYNEYVGNSKCPTAAMRKGLGAAIAGFDAYRLEKYRRSGHTISLHDAINVLHPPGSDLIGAFLSGDLEPPETWEIRMTQAGQEGIDAGEVWKELLEADALPYFATLRNLRNIMQDGTDAALTMALDVLTDERRIRGSKVLPFRYQTAFKAVSEVQSSKRTRVIRGLEKAVRIALDNVPELPGRTLVAVDDSLSMTTRQGKSVTPIEIATLFAAILARSNDADVMLFSSDAEYVALNPDDSVLTNSRLLQADLRAKGTNFHCVFETAGDTPYDRIIFLSDMQGWEERWNQATPEEAHKEYKAKSGADPHIYSFDLGGYGTGMFPEKRLYKLAGFSDKVFDFMEHAEAGTEALIQAIENVDL